MSISISLARRIAAGAIGTGAVAGAMFFSGAPVASAAPAPMPAVGPAVIAPMPPRTGYGHGPWGHGPWGWGHPGWGWGQRGWGLGHGGFWGQPGFWGANHLWW
jgi:hypothetical protein